MHYMVETHANYKANIAKIINNSNRFSTLQINENPKGHYKKLLRENIVYKTLIEDLNLPKVTWWQHENLFPEGYLQSKINETQDAKDFSDTEIKRMLPCIFDRFNFMITNPFYEAGFPLKVRSKTVNGKSDSYLYLPQKNIDDSSGLTEYIGVLLHYPSGDAFGEKPVSALILGTIAKEEIQKHPISRVPYGPNKNIEAYSVSIDSYRSLNDLENKISHPRVHEFLDKLIL